jgi:hypothetical protein
MKNYNILELIYEAYQEKVEQKNIRDIGKFLQFVAEGYARRWLKEECGIDSSCAENDENGNETTWDILTENSIREQVKYRGGKSASGRPKLFLETTRRNSKKNVGAKSQSGHVAYGSDEFDVALFVVPSKDFDFLNTSGLEIIAIPAKELVDPNHPEILVKNVPSKLMDRYLGKAKEVVLSYEKCQ